MRVLIVDPDDARGALLLTDAHYGAVVSQPSHPWTAGSAHLYTREFFALCLEHLGPQGVLALRLRGAENIWTPHLARRTGSQVRALEIEALKLKVLPERYARNTQTLSLSDQQTLAQSCAGIVGAGGLGGLGPERIAAESRAGAVG